MERIEDVRIPGNQAHARARIRKYGVDRAWAMFYRDKISRGRFRAAARNYA